jgi:hypothetical protein
MQGEYINIHVLVRTQMHIAMRIRDQGLGIVRQSKTSVMHASLDRICSAMGDEKQSVSA